MPWLQKICKSNHIVSVEEECCFHILFLLFPEVVKINITCPRGLKIWARNVTHHCLSLCCGGYPRERVSIHDDSSQNSSQWSVKLWSLDFLGCVYLGYRTKTVPTFALALPKRICLWVFLRKVVCSVSVEKTVLKTSVFTHLRLSDSICCNLNVCILTAACKFSIRLLPSCRWISAAPGSLKDSAKVHRNYLEIKKFPSIPTPCDLSFALIYTRAISEMPWPVNKKPCPCVLCTKEGEISFSS